jgi:hypothetical protein
MHPIYEFSVINAVCGVLLFVIAMGTIWYRTAKLHLEMRELVAALPRMGSEFIREEIKDVRQDLDITRARVSNCERELGLDGEVT